MTEDKEESEPEEHEEESEPEEHEEESEPEEHEEESEPELNVDEEYKVETVVNIAKKLADGDFSNSPEDRDELVKIIHDKYLDEILKTSKIEEPKLNLDYNAYNFARSSAILSLEFSWVKIESKLKNLIEQLRYTNLTDDDIDDIEKAIEKFRRKCISKTIDFKKPKNQNENAIDEPEIFEEIMKSLQDIYSEFFDVFLEPITNWSSSNGSHLNSNESMKFRAYNLDLRKKKAEDSRNGRQHIPDYRSCNYDYYAVYLKNKPYVKGTLYHGFWQVESMMNELRNHTEHWKKRGGKTYLKNNLKRDMLDPLSETESPANFIILVSVLLLISYQFIEVIQTWIDTDTLLKQ